MPTLSYRLPLSSLKIAGTVTYVADPLVSPREQAQDPEAEVELRVTGDEAHPRSVQLDAKKWRDSTASFEFTEDGRLASTSRDVVGQGGKILTGVVEVVTSVAGAVLAVAGRRSLRPVPGGQTADQLAAEAAGEQQLLTAVDEAYRMAHPEEAALRERLQALSRTIPLKIADAIASVGDAQSPTARKQARQLLRSLRMALAAAREELERIDRHFQAWRATTQKKREEQYEYTITLDEIAMAKVQLREGDLVFPEPEPGDSPDKMKAAQEEIRAAWTTLGVVVQVDDTRRRVLRADVARIPAPASRSIVARLPRSVNLRTFIRQANGKAALKSSRPVMVLDELCDHFELDVNAGLFGEGKGSMVFSSDGVLTKVESATKSSAASAVAALGTVPATVASSLETANKIADQVNTLREKPNEFALTRVKQQLALKQNQIDLAGLNATETDYAELKRLTQEAELLQKRKDIAAFWAPEPDAISREIAQLKQQIELLKARRQVDRLQDAMEEGDD